MPDRPSTPAQPDQPDDSSHPPPSQPPSQPPPSQPPPPGAQPPAPPSGQPPAPPGGARGYNLADAFNYGWAKFQANLGPILTGALVVIGLALVVGVLWFFLGGAIAGTVGDTNVGAVAFLVSTAVFALVWVALAFLIQAAVIRAGLAIADGRPIELSTLLSTERLGAIIAGAVVVGVASSIGYVLCVLPGLAVMFYTQFFMFFIVDKGMGAVDAIRASYEFVQAHVGEMVALFLAVYIANAIGGMLCGVGLLVSFPVTVIAQTYAYRRLRGEPVAA